MLYRFLQSVTYKPIKRARYLYISGIFLYTLSMLKQYVLQDYIKTITSILLNEQKETVKLNEIAAKFNISTSAVSDMVKKLVKEGLVINLSYKGIKLTDKGFQMGKQIIRHHRLWESFLYEVLKLPWHKIHDEAENLEHASSDALINQLDAYLNFPKTDPHGNPIPAQDGTIEYSKDECMLSEASTKTPYKILRFIAFDPSYLDFLASQGLHIGTPIQINRHLAFDNSLVCEVDQNEIILTAISANNIYVTPL